MPNHPREVRKRVGEMLVRRRIDLDPRYRTRTVFVAERAPGLYRVINAAETGERDNFESATLATLEAAYDLAPGAISRALDASGLVPLQPRMAAPADPPAVPPAFITREMQDIATPHADAIWRKLISLDPGHAPRLADDMPDPGGAALFGEGTDDAAYWDLLGRKGRTVRERVWSLADLRAREAAVPPARDVPASAWTPPPYYDQARADRIRPFAESLHQRWAELRASGTADPSGADLLDDPLYAHFWDEYRQTRRRSPEAVIVVLAEMLASAAEEAGHDRSQGSA